MSTEYTNSLYDISPSATLEQSTELQTHPDNHHYSRLKGIMAAAMATSVLLASCGTEQEEPVLTETSEETPRANQTTTPNNTPYPTETETPTTAETTEAEETSTAVPVSTVIGGMSYEQLKAIAPDEINVNVPDERFTPILMTSDDPEKLMAQYANNLVCLMNAVNYWKQMQCRGRITLDTHDDTTIADLMGQLATDGGAERYLDSSWVHPYEVTEILNHKQEGNLMVIIARTDEGELGGVNDMKYTFVKEPAMIRLTDEDFSDTMAWRLTGLKIIKDGDYTIGDLGVLVKSTPSS